MYNIKGIDIIPRMLGAKIPNGRLAHGFELASSATWAEVMSLKGEVLPNLGEILDVGAPRLDLLPKGTPINLVTAG